MAMADSVISFVGGAAYGLTSVATGQPLDTVKTRMQSKPSDLSSGMFRTALDLFKREGIRGLYRGGMPQFVGGSLYRSAQFGFYHTTLGVLRERTPQKRIGGILDWQVVVAGFAGGIGRGLVEGPFEYIKVRRQVAQPWSFKGLLSGAGITLTRNAGVFSTFVIYIDLSKQLIEGGMGPFVTGGVCSSLAWATVWPLDVIKSQRQSGNFAGKSTVALLKDAWQTGKLYRGLTPGLSRSFVANGCSMVVMDMVVDRLYRAHFGHGKDE